MTVDRELPVGPMGYAIEKESRGLLMAGGMDPVRMLKLAAESKPDFNVQANPMTLFNPLNQGSQGACFPAGTKVTLASGELKNIEDIQFGDTVLTHKGRARQVIDTMVRPYTGQLHRVFVKGWGAVTMTADHIVLASRNGKTEWLRADQLTDSDGLIVSRGPQEQCLESIDLSDFVPELYEDDGLVSSKDSPAWVSRYLPLDDLTCFILGLYCAEGSTDRTCGGKANRAVFTMHEDEVSEHQQVEAFANRMGAGFIKQIRTSSKAVNLRVASPVFARFVELVCGKFCNYKKVPEFILCGRNEQKLAFLRGYFAGDGCMTKLDQERTAKSGNRVQTLQIHAATASRVLAQQVSTLLVSLGMKPGRTLTKSRPHQRYHSYQTYLYSKDAFTFVGRDDYSSTGTNPQTKSWCDEGQVRRIRTIDKIDAVNHPVYDITVAEDHSFVAQGLVVHNCQGHSLALIFSICYYLSTGRIEMFSRGGAYYLSQRKDGINGDRGSTLSGGQWVATEHGLCLEADWPYPERYNPAQPSGIKFPFKLVASQPTQDYELISEALDMGLPVQDGIIWDSSVSRTISSDYTGSGGGGHSTTLWCKVGENYRRINSWGMWDGDGCNENTPKSLKKQVEHRYSSHVIYAPEGMIYPETKPVA